MDTTIFLPTRHKLDDDRYVRMVDAGLLAEGSRVELIEVHQNPTGGAYAEMSTLQPGQPITLSLAPEIVVAPDPVFAAL